MTWQLEELGICDVARDYFIDACRLGDMRDNGLLCWPMHMAHKTWVDYPAFAEVFERAISQFEVDISSDLVKVSLLAGQARSAWGIAHQSVFEQICRERGNGMIVAAAELGEICDEATKRLLEAAQ